MKIRIASLTAVLILMFLTLPVSAQEGINLRRIRQTIQTEVTIELEVDGQTVETTVPATIMIDAEIDLDALTAQAPVEPTATAVAPSATPTVAPTPVPDEDIVTDYDSICDIKSGMTDVQVDAYYESLRGKKIVDWYGYVYDVYERGGTYVVLIANRPKGFMWSRQIELRGVPREVAVQLNKEQRVKYSATIHDVETFLTSNCNPLILNNVSIEIVD